MSEFAGDAAPESRTAINLAADHKPDADAGSRTNEHKIRHQTVARFADLQTRFIHGGGGRVVFDHNPDVFVRLQGGNDVNIVPVKIRRVNQFAAFRIGQTRNTDADHPANFIPIRLYQIIDPLTHQFKSGFGFRRRCKIIFVRNLAFERRHSDLRGADAEVHADKIIGVVNERQNARFAPLSRHFERFLAQYPSRNKRFDVFGDRTFVNIETIGDLGARNRLRRPNQSQQQASLFGNIRRSRRRICQIILKNDRFIHRIKKI